MCTSFFFLLTIFARTVLCEVIQRSPREEAPSNRIGGITNYHQVTMSTSLHWHHSSVCVYVYICVYYFAFPFVNLWIVSMECNIDKFFIGQFLWIACHPPQISNHEEIKLQLPVERQAYYTNHRHVLVITRPHQLLTLEWLLLIK